MKSGARSIRFVFLLAAIAAPLAAHDYPLSSRRIREAYFAGKASAESRAAFFAQYTENPPMPKSGPHVAMIRIETPYAFVAERSADALANYFAPDAEAEFLGKSALFRVYVAIDLTPSYPPFIESPDGTFAARPMDFWRGFAIRLIQNDKEIPPQSTEGEGIRDIPVESGGHAPVGADVEIKYDAEKIQPAPVTIEVVTPDGRHVTAAFDLAKLR